jgi:hypothetical protein
LNKDNDVQIINSQTVQAGFTSDIYLSFFSFHSVTHHNVLEATVFFFRFTLAGRWKQPLPKCSMLRSVNGQCPNENQRLNVRTVHCLIEYN